MEKQLTIERTIRGTRPESGNLSQRDRLHIRIQERASIAGDGEQEITQYDYEQAKRDLAVERDIKRQNTALASPTIKRS